MPEESQQPSQPSPPGREVTPDSETPVDETGPVAAGTGKPGFPIVAVGASAGGLEAFTQMLHALPTDTGMAFVLVQHLAPTHASILAELLSRATAMPVMEVQDESAVKPNHVYVIPPDRSMIISDDILRLLPREIQRGQHRPIDRFFQSLAENQLHQAIGVVLSGTATDGTAGLEHIKAEGGITFAQDDTAQHDGMPRSAIAAGCVDFVLSPGEIAREIASIARHPYVAPASGKAKVLPDEKPGLATVLECLRGATGVDFTHYKENTLYRRIARRMVLHKIEALADYGRFLQENTAEVNALYHDVLINVTSFFRNPEMFETLKAKVFPRLAKDRARNKPMRIWVLGCSTGEEAYSLAIAFAEFAEAEGLQVPLQIFASDLNELGVEKARAGLYSKDIEDDVSPDRLRRFFAEVDGGYRITKSIRDSCVFARHNVLADPPFTHMDLISCRNMLIYLGSALQRQVVPLLHYALSPAGCLVLGGSETVGSYRDLFEVVDARQRIYSKVPGARAAAIPVIAGERASGHAMFSPTIVSAREPPGGADAHKEADRLLLATYAPPAVLINVDMEILQVRGDVGPFLAPAPGKASLSLLKMAREGLAITLRAAVQRARKEQIPVREEGVRVKSDAGYRQVNLAILPVKGNSGDVLVVFEDAAAIAPHAATTGTGGVEATPDASTRDRELAQQEITRVTQELAATRDYLQATIEQQEASTEELQSANEEAQSANEELQSINEELETSKEEIQSSNEELATVNDELRHRNLELTQLNNDMINLVGSAHMAVVILGRDLRIRRFTPMAEKTLNLIPSDLGRPIGDRKLKIDIPDLDALLAAVIDTVSVKERDVRDRDGRWYSLRIRPYKTLDNKIDGAVLVLLDIDTLRHALAYAESIVATVRAPLLVLDSALRVRSASRSFYETFETVPEETENKRLYDLGQGKWDIPGLRRLLEEVLPRDNFFDDYQVNFEFEHVGRKTMLLNARRLIQETGQEPLILLAIEDVTERTELEEALQEHVGRLKTADRSKNEFLIMLAHELRGPLAPLRNALQILRSPAADGDAMERAREMMGRQVHNMSRMIDDLLDVSRITQDKVQLRKEPVELGSVLGHVVEAALHQIDARGQKLAVSLPPQPAYVEADVTRLEQLFGNLLNNASKYTEEGGHIWLSAEVAGNEHRDAVGDVVVTVRDDGIGIDPEMLPRVFDLFAQADRSLSRSHGGLGIGLTLARSLAELHGGSIEAHSDGLRKGSEFIVRLPALAVAAAAEKPPDDSRPASGVAVPKSRRILLVDDNVDTVRSMGMLLRFDKHEVQTAHDGPAALHIAQSFRPEVVLLDIGLPGLDGYQVARLLRARPEMATAILVAVTGYGTNEERELAREAGFDHHLVKPIDPEVLRDFLSGRRALNA